MSEADVPSGSEVRPPAEVAPGPGRAGVERVVLDLRDAPTGVVGLVVARQVLQCTPASTEQGCDRIGVDGADAEVLVAAVGHEPWLVGEVDDEAVTIDVRGTEDHGRVVLDLTEAGGERSIASTPTAAADRALGILTRARLDREVGRLRLHGGAVADAHGRAVVVLGPSGAGKSTLIAHLAHAGLGLVNDEQVALFPEIGVVAGFTRPVAIKPGGAAHLPPAVASGIRETGATVLITARDLGTAHRLAARPVVTVLPERLHDEGEGEGELSWEVLAPGHALEALLANNLDLENRPVEGLRAAAWLVNVGPVVRLRYRNAADACIEVQRLLAAPPARPAVPTATVIDHAADASAGDVSDLKAIGAPGGGGPRIGGSAASFAISPEVASVDLGHEVLVYHRSTRAVALLNPAGAQRWRRLPLAEVPGDPEDQAFLKQLVSHGLVTEHQAPSGDATAHGGGYGSAVLARGPRLVSRRMRGGVMVTGPTGSFHRLEGSTAVVWNHLDLPRSAELLAEMVAADSDGGPGADLDAVRTEVIRALAELVDAGLLVRSDDPLRTVP